MPYLYQMSIQAVQYDKGAYVGQKVQERHFGPIITTETVFPEGLSSDLHYHSNPHFSHILSGGSREIRPGSTQEQGAGAGLYYYPGIAHQNVDYRPGTRIFNIELEPGFFSQYGSVPPGESLMLGNHRPINTNGLLKILKEHYLCDSESGMAIEQLCLSLVQGEAPAEKLYPEWTEKIRAVLNDQWDVPLTLPQLAEQLSLHPVTISRYFSRYFTCTLGEYRRRVKVERALPMVREGRLSLTEIAYSCGFADQAHFTRTFQHITGLLPKQYKNL